MQAGLAESHKGNRVACPFFERQLRSPVNFVFRLGPLSSLIGL